MSTRKPVVVKPKGKLVPYNISSLPSRIKAAVAVDSKGKLG